MCSCELSGKAYRVALRRLEATEARLRQADRRDGGHRLRDHNRDQSRLFRERMKSCTHWW